MGNSPSRSSSLAGGPPPSHDGGAAAGPSGANLRTATGANPFDRLGSAENFPDLGETLRYDDRDASLGGSGPSIGTLANLYPVDLPMLPGQRQQALVGQTSEGQHAEREAQRRTDKWFGQQTLSKAIKVSPACAACTSTIAAGPPLLLPHTPTPCSCRRHSHRSPASPSAPQGDSPTPSTQWHMEGLPFRDGGPGPEPSTSRHPAGACCICMVCSTLVKCARSFFLSLFLYRRKPLP